MFDVAALPLHTRLSSHIKQWQSEKKHYIASIHCTMAKLTVFLAVLAAFLLISAHAQSTPCPCVCRRNRDPVCTEDQHGVKKVYDNACRVECANRCDNAGAVEVANSECGLAED